MTAERKVYTLTQLNQSLENHFWSQFGDRSFWVTAEIVKVNVKNGHYYLELADSKNELTTARSFATIWSRTFKLIQDRVGATELAGILKPGNNVLFSLKIEYHAVYGLKLNVIHIDPTYSYGAIEKKRKEVIEQLRKEHLLTKQQELKLPTIIKRIALIGSPETSGFRDFQDELLNNHDFNQFIIKVFPVRVQGNQARDELVEAVNQASCFDVDAIVILRGGGSKMDLAIFDDYELAKSIANARIPVLTGIGHETDKVVADLVAHTFFITPTAVARHIQYAISSFWEIMRELQDKTIHYSQQLLSDEREAFTHVNNYLQHYSRGLIQHWKSVFQEFETNVHTGAVEILNRSKRGQDSVIHNLIHQVGRNVQNEQHDLDRVLDRLQNNAVRTLDEERSFTLQRVLEQVEGHGSTQVERERIALGNLEELLTLLNPMKVLASGYTISTIEGIDAQKFDGEVEGKELKTLTSTSLITSTVNKIEKVNKNDENK